MDSFTTYLQEFFALCSDGVWQVTCLRENGGSPIVKRIAKRPGGVGIENRQLKPGTGTCVAVTQQYIALYHQKPDYDRDDPVILQLPEEINSSNLGWKTGKVLALFLAEKDAMEENKKADAALSMLELEQYTAETLTKIGENHPVFVVARNNGDEKISFPISLYDVVGINRNSVPTIPKALLLESFNVQADSTPGWLSRIQARRDSSAQQAISPSHSTTESEIKGPEPIHQLIPARQPKPRRPKNESNGPPERLSIPVPKIELIVQSRHPQVTTPKTTSQEIVRLPMEEKVFLRFLADREVKRIVNGEQRRETLLEGEYEMIRIKDPTGGNNPWLVTKEDFPHKIIGNSERAFSQWYEISDKQFAIKFRTEPLSTQTAK